MKAKRVILVSIFAAMALVGRTLAQQPAQQPAQQLSQQAAPQPAQQPAAPAEIQAPASAAAPAPGAQPGAPVDAAPPADPARTTAADEAAIRKNAQAYDDAWNARDGKALAAMWSEQAIYVDPETGLEVIGRENLEKYFAETLSDADTKLSVEVTSVEFVSPNVAIERGVAHVTSPNGTVEESTYSAVNVKQGGQWLLDRVAEEGVVKPPKSNYDHLKELEWMIGTWLDEDDDVTIQTDVDWTKNKNFITRSFSATIGDQIDMSGMQIIGWDPASKEIRSWVFDSDGGFGEGKWKKAEGGRWIIQYSGTLPDGSKMSGNNVMTYIDDNAYGWESINRQIGGQILPNIDEVIIVRADANMEADPARESDVQTEVNAEPAPEPAAAAPAGQ
jgi:uncharacterized protein (TIGR02246 family)